MISWVNDMPADDRRREYRREMLAASALIAVGLACVLQLISAYRNPPRDVGFLRTVRFYLFFPG